MLEDRPFGMEDYTNKSNQNIRVSALNREVGGEHYKSAYQPIQLMENVKMYACCSFILKYVYRYKNKNGKQDLEKALHCCELLEQLGGNWYQGNGGIGYFDTSHDEFYKFIKANKQLDANQIRAILAIENRDMETLKYVINDDIIRLS